MNEVELIFVEQIHLTYDRLIKWCRNNPKAIVMLGICEKPWFIGKLGEKMIYKPCAKIEDSLPFYKLLHELSLPNPIGLHVHILPKDIDFIHIPLQSKDKDINLVSYDEQYRQIKLGKDLLESIGIKTKYFSSGWWLYNLDTFKVSHDLGFERIYVDPDYKKNIRVDGIKTILIRESLHDGGWLVEIEWQHGVK